MTQVHVAAGWQKTKSVLWTSLPYLILLHNMVSTADGIGDVFRQSPMLNFVVKCKCYIFYRMTVLMQQPKTLRMEPLTEMETAFVGQWIIT